MAVWVAVREENEGGLDEVHYVRGDQIVAVTRYEAPSRDSVADSELAEILRKRFSVRVTIVQPDGNSSRPLWRFADQAKAANAALELLQALSTNQTGIVVLNEENDQVELVPVGTTTG